MPTIRERNGRYQAQVRIKKNGVIVHQESETFDTRKQAELWGLTLERKLERSGYVEHNLERTTVRRVLELYDQTMQSVGRSSRGYVCSIADMTASAWTAKSVSAVRSADISEWAMKYAVGRSPATVLHALMTLRSAYRVAMTMHNIPTNVEVVASAIKQLMHLKVAAKSQERDRRVTDAEVNELCKWHERKDSAIPLRFICNLAIHLPRRREELLTMCGRDYKEGVLKLWDTKDPNQMRDEVIPVPPKAQELLSTIKIPDGIILPYLPKTISTSFGRATKLAGLDDLHFHDLRHEGVSRLFEAGLNIPEVALISGHKSWVTLQRYTHLKPKQVLEKLNASDKRAEEIAAQSKRP